MLKQRTAEEVAAAEPHEAVPSEPVFTQSSFTAALHSAGSEQAELLNTGKSALRAAGSSVTWSRAFSTAVAARGLKVTFPTHTFPYGSETRAPPPTSRLRPSNVVS